MGDIFFSYSRADQEVVEDLVQRLERRGFSVWWDGHIPPGENFRTFIDEKLNEAPAICVVWSANSVNSRWVTEEAEEGLKRTNLVPISIDISEIPRGFRSIQSAQLLSDQPAARYDDEFEKLVDRLKAITKSAPATKSKVRRKRPSPLTQRVARTQNLAMMIAFIAVIVAFVAYDFLINPKIESLGFRLGIFLPTFLALTGLLYLSRRPWHIWVLNVLGTWAAVVLVYYQVKQFGLEDFGPSGFGTTLNIVLSMVLSGVGLVHSHTSRFVGQFGAVALYGGLCYLDGVRDPAFWATALSMTSLVALFLCVGFMLRDRRLS